MKFGSKDLSKILSKDNGSDGIALDMGMGLKDLVFSEEDIIQADQFCAEIVCEFVWDGEGILDILKRGGSTQKPIKWLQSKPASAHRVDQLNDLIIIEWRVVELQIPFFIKDIWKKL